MGRIIDEIVDMHLNGYSSEAIASMITRLFMPCTKEEVEDITRHIDEEMMI